MVYVCDCYFLAYMIWLIDFYAMRSCIKQEQEIVAARFAEWDLS